MLGDYALVDRRLVLHVKEFVDFLSVLRLTHSTDGLPSCLSVHATLPFDEEKGLGTVNLPISRVGCHSINLSEQVSLEARSQSLIRLLGFFEKAVAKLRSFILCHVLVEGNLVIIFCQ